MTSVTRTSILLAFAFLSTAACHKKKPVEVAPTPVLVNNPPVATDNSAERDRLERERLERERPSAAQQTFVHPRRLPGRVTVAQYFRFRSTG